MLGLRPVVLCVWGRGGGGGRGSLNTPRWSPGPRISNLFNCKSVKTEAETRGPGDKANTCRAPMKLKSHSTVYTHYLHGA